MATKALILSSFSFSKPVPTSFFASELREKKKKIENINKLNNNYKLRKYLKGKMGYKDVISSFNETTESTVAQDWNAENYRKNCSFVPFLGLPVIDLLNPLSGERILDLGCGDGKLTKKIIELGCDVTGVDSSEDMIRLARSDGIDAEVMDGHRLKYHEEFDAVFTNAALHWMKADPRAVVKGVKIALRPGGRFVGEAGGYGNVAAITTALVAVLNARNIVGKDCVPWFFPSAEEYREILEEEGFYVEVIELFPRPTELPSGMMNWIETFGNPFFHGMSKQERENATEEALELLKPSLCDYRGNWMADYVRLRFRASLVEN